MQLDPSIVAAASERISRKGLPVAAPSAARDILTTLPADRLLRLTRYIDTKRVADDVSAYERAVGTNDLLGLSYFWAGLRAARSVARISIAASPGDRGGDATGFMIAPNILLTNHHVFKTAEGTRRARAQFAYEADATGNERLTTWFSFKSGGFYFASEALDYCMVELDPATQKGPDGLDSFGWLRLNKELGKTDYGQFLSIIQHPGGQPKQIAIRENQLLPFEDAELFLTYRSDTFRGSSGSPVFNDYWDVVALHHSGKPAKDAQGHYIGHDDQPIVDRTPQEHEIKWLANEGARTSFVVNDFLARAPAGAARSVIERAMSGQLLPSIQPLEIGPTRGIGSESTPFHVESGPSPRAFTLTLPLNVSLRVESLSEPPALPLPTPVVVSLPQAAPSAADDINLEKLNFDSDYSGRNGYDEFFLGRERRAPIPTIDKSARGQIAPTKMKGLVLHYHHFSLMMHRERRMPVLGAWNTDYSEGQRKLKGRKTFGKDEWILDDRMDSQYQLPKGFYDRWKRIDFGHLVRRDDNCWGASKTEIEFANSDTFHLTNCTPQHESFNRDVGSYHGLWGRLENRISRQAGKHQALARLSIFGGPIFGTKDWPMSDSEEGKILAPVEFWKVIIAPAGRNGVQAFGFILKQLADLKSDRPFEEELDVSGFENEQASLAEIEAKTIVRFDKELKAVDVMAGRPSGQQRVRIVSEEEIYFGGT